VYCFFATKQRFAQTIGHTALRIVRLMQKLQHNWRQTSASNEHLLIHLSQRIGERPWGHQVYQPCNIAFNTIVSSQGNQKVIKKNTWYLQISVGLCTHSPHNEITNFIGEEITNTRSNARMFENANVYMTKKTARWKISKGRHMKKINSIIKGSFAVSI